MLPIFISETMLICLLLKNANWMIALKTTLFFIYQEKNLIDTLSRTVIINRKKETARFSRNENKAIFHPTPLSTRPKPPGGPSYCWIEEDDEN